MNMEKTNLAYPVTLALVSSPPKTKFIDGSNSDYAKAAADAWRGGGRGGISIVIVVVVVFVAPACT